MFSLYHQKKILSKGTQLKEGFVAQYVQKTLQRKFLNKDNLFAFNWFLS